MYRDNNLIHIYILLFPYKDDDVEIQGAGQLTVLPQNGRILDLKDPLIWEMLALTQHCNSKVRITARQIIGIY